MLKTILLCTQTFVCNIESFGVRVCDNNLCDDEEETHWMGSLRAARAVLWEQQKEKEKFLGVLNSRRLSRSVWNFLLSRQDTVSARYAAFYYNIIIYAHTILFIHSQSALFEVVCNLRLFSLRWRICSIHGFWDYLCAWSFHFYPSSFSPKVRLRFFWSNNRSVIIQRRVFPLHTNQSEV